MIRRNATHCLRPGCDTWSYDPEDHGFIAVIWDGVETAYCSLGCLMTDISVNRSPKPRTGE